MFADDCNDSSPELTLKFSQQIPLCSMPFRHTMRRLVLAPGKFLVVVEGGASLPVFTRYVARLTEVCDINQEHVTPTMDAVQRRMDEDSDHEYGRFRGSE